MNQNSQTASESTTPRPTTRGDGLSRRGFLTLAPALTAGAAWGQAAPATSPANTEATAPALPPVGTLLQLPQMQLFDGTTFQPASADGHLLVLYWWSSTCPFCALQSPEMQKLWMAHKKNGLQMLTLSVDRKPQDALVYLQKKGYTFPAGFVTPDVQRVLPKPRGLPITLVRGRDGRVLQAERGQLFPEDVEQMARWL